MFISREIYKDIQDEHEEEWKNSPTPLVINGIKNPFKTKDLIYYRSTYPTDMDGKRIHKHYKSNFKGFCRAEVYLLPDDIKEIKQDVILLYLRQFDKKVLRQAYQQDKRTYIWCVVVWDDLDAVVWFNAGYI